PNLVNAGNKIIFSITSTHLTMISTASHEIIAQHQLAMVSFTLANAVSEQDRSPDSRYAAYVVHDRNASTKLGRVCVVLDCGEQTNDVIRAIGQAFDVMHRLNGQQRKSVGANTTTATTTGPSITTEHQSDRIA